MAPRIAILMFVQVGLGLKTEKLLVHFSIGKDQPHVVLGSIIYLTSERFVHINMYGTT